MRAAFFLFAIFATPLVGMQTGADIQVNDGGGVYYDDDSYDGYWYGPGWYWGVYIDNEDDYWRHHGNRYGHHGNGHNHGGGDHHGGGHGGGGHGGGHR